MRRILILFLYDCIYFYKTHEGVVTEESINVGGENSKDNLTIYFKYREKKQLLRSVIYE